MTDERIEAVARAICAAQTDDDYWETLCLGAADSPDAYAYQREIDGLMAQARAAVAAMGEEPTLEAQLNAAWWITHFEVTANEDEQYDALITGYMSEDLHLIGKVTGSTIATAIRAAVANAKEEG